MFGFIFVYLHIVLALYRADFTFSAFFAQLLGAMIPTIAMSYIESLKILLRLS